MSDKKFSVVYRGILAIIIVQNPPEDVVEKYRGFFHDIAINDDVAWILLYNVSNSDLDIVNEVITSFEEAGFTQHSTEEVL